MYIIEGDGKLYKKGRDVLILKISEVHIGQRVRDEYGDMESLANSIKEHGLLHPIVVDSNYNLIAGCRRLLACERIGLKEIEAKVLADISEKELRVLELEENIRRKDLTDLEKSKNLVELAEIKEQEILERTEKITTEVLSESDKTNKGGRPSKNGVPLQKISDELNIPRVSLIDAQQHIKAVEEFPELSGLPKYKAMETAKELREAPPEEHDKILDFAQRKAETPAGKKEDDYYSYMDECGKITKKYHKALYAFLCINADNKDFKMISEVILPQVAETYLYETEDTIKKLLRVQNFLKGVIENAKIRTKGQKND